MSKELTTKEKIEWETIVASPGNTHLTSRIKVFEGWIFRHRTSLGAGHYEMSLCFISDKYHEWKI